MSRSGLLGSLNLATCVREEATGGGPPGEEEEEKRMQWCAKVAANFAPGQPCPRQ